MVFNRHKGRKWLADILNDVSEKIEEISGYGWVKRTAPEKSKIAITWSARVVRRATQPLRQMSTMFGRNSGSTGSTDSVESNPPPYSSSTILPSTGIFMSPRTDFATPTAVQSQPGHEEERDSGEVSGCPSDASPVASPTTPSSPEPGTKVSPARVRFVNIVRSAVMANRLSGIGDEAKAKVPRSLKDGRATDRESETVTMPSSRIAGLIPRLQRTAPAQDIAAHTALVRHMQVSTKPLVTFVPVFDCLCQFSPDGKFLATCSWDRTSVIFRVGVCLVDVSLHHITERLSRNNSLPIRYCCTPPDSSAKLHGESYCFGNTRHE